MATSVIGALRVTLGLDSGPFARGARSAMGSLDRLKGSLQAISATMAAVGGAAFLMVSQTAQAANEIARQSQIANTSAAQFQRMAAGARTVGIEQDKLADILKDVNDRVGDFLQTGGGPMADFFENVAPQVGVTADMFRDLSGADALQLYVQTLERAGLSQQEMTFYMEAMASDATALIPLLANNGAELERLGAAAEASGVVMSDALIAKSGDFREAMNGLRNGLMGIRNDLAERLMPIFTELVNKITNDVLPVVRDIIGVVGEWVTAFQDLPGPVQEAVGVIVAALAAGGPLLLAVAGVKMAFAALMGTGPIGVFIGAATLITVAWAKWGDDIKAAIGPTLEWIKSTFDSVVAAIQSMIDKAGEARDALANMLAFGDEGVAAQIEAEGDAFAEEFARTHGLPGAAIGGAMGEGIVQGLTDSDVVERVGTVMSDVAAEARRMMGINSPSRVFREIGQWLSAGLGLGIRDGEAGVGQAMADVAGTTTDAVAEVADEVQRLESTALSAFKGLVQGTLSWQDALSSVASTLADMLLDSAFQSLFGPMFASGGAVTDFMGALGFRAEGGPVTAGQPYVVGEVGPELFVPTTAGHIVSNADLGNGGGGAAHVYLHVPEGVTVAQATDIAGQVAVSVVSDYDQMMPARVAAINADPRKR